jgi:formylglycine-generating enzyme required for sulfatase activity/serine/threonine protein kinase
MAICKQCGRENAATARFCANCGAELAPASSPTSLKPGQTMNGGQYRIVRQLGRGGMGAIYLAENTQAFNRQCVIKEMIAYYEPGEERKAQERFEREARTLAALKHPGIPDMYGFFSEGGHHYIVMEYIEGENLESFLTHETRTGELMRGQPLPLADVVRYGIEICRVLEYLAQIAPEPVVHCDIKPGNIIIERNSQQAVLVDFGTAKRRHADAAAPDPKRASVYGTVGYAPPELYHGQAVPKSDVFSLAATLYHLLTDDDPSDHPFQWPQMERIPPPLRLILERALANDLATRLDAEQFRRQLEAYRASQAGTIAPLAFPEGNLATSLSGVLDLSLRYWDYARQILLDGSLDAWLRHALHDPVAANRAQEALREYPSSADAALDDFLRSLNPRLPGAQMQLAPTAVDFGTVAPGAKPSATLSLENRGPGGARGTIRSSTPWLKVTPTTYALGPAKKQEIQVELLASENLASLPRQKGRVEILPLNGTPLAAEITVDVRNVAVPASAPTASTSATAQASGQRPTRTRTKRASARIARKRATAKRWIVWTLLGIFVLGALLAGAVHLLPLAPTANVERGLEALAEGHWAQAARWLAKVDPEDSAQVERVGAALDALMVPVAGGTLHMGWEEGSLDQRPVHDVSVAEFAMDRFEVTNVQYQRVVQATGHTPPRHWPGGHFPKGQALHPVVHVTWDDALAYAAWTGKRLPTEAEWEWAARGAEGRLYPWGNEFDANQANFKSSRQSPRGAVAVGSYPGDATPQGIMDLAGNVREWTADRYAPYQDPHRPPKEGNEIAVRGSSWRTSNDVVSARQKERRDATADDLGFRCVR